ncbi:unnamed protein product [marine sediment metagenome]|uniref:Sulfatase N-terminal domain-containing protein n=1 Tax=marine sediment metagenome TaxID=412755 RepID=X0SBI6_9ZZZZ
MRVYLIAIDTLRADYLHCYGYPRTTSPNLDKLAADGTVFEYCITPATHIGYRSRGQITHGCSSIETPRAQALARRPLTWT